ncbi:MAG: SDR family oxidoreductase [Gloeobacteraceae cyanobacterium ES-bin-144]|nr:SDR family oxidoreductase [Verrucomicrobiales bacterium]
MNEITQYSCVLVTGASSGLGEQFALQLAPLSRHLVLVARRESLLLDLAARIRADFPEVGVSVFAVDLTSNAERDRLLTELASHRLQPDLLVNNAGLGDYGEFTTSEWPKIEAMLRVNVEALTHLTHALLPGMIRSGAGAILNVSSLASLLPIPDFAVYAATKAYVTSFSEALRIELREHGIPVLAVCPGPVHTEFGKVAERNERKIPGRESFYVPREQVVAEALIALDRKQARVYPGLKTAVAAVAISLVPIVLMRVIMGYRPRKR